MTRTEGERVRAIQKIKHLRAALDAVEISLRDSYRGVPVGTEIAQTVSHAAIDLSLCLARCDAYQRAADDVEAAR